MTVNHMSRDYFLLLLEQLYYNGSKVKLYEKCNQITHDI